MHACVCFLCFNFTSGVSGFLPRFVPCVVARLVVAASREATHIDHDVPLGFFVLLTQRRITFYLISHFVVIFFPLFLIPIMNLGSALQYKAVLPEFPQY